MAVDGIVLEEYIFVSGEDKGDPKTEFFMRPMKKMESFKIGAIYNLIAGSGEKDTAEKIIEAFEEKGDSIEGAIYGYIESHCKEVRNFKINGQLVTGQIDKFLDAIGPMLAMEIVGDAINRTSIKADEAKN